MEGQRGTVDRVTGVQERLHRTERNSVRRGGRTHRGVYVGDKVKVTPGFILLLLQTHPFNSPTHLQLHRQPIRESSAPENKHTSNRQ